MNTKMIKVNTSIPMSKIVDLVSTVVKLSFDEHGVYHKYLRDYAEALMILSVFTDYDGETDIDTITGIRLSSDWNNIVNVNVNKEIAAFKEYVEDEISRRTAPFAEVTEMIRVVKNAAVKILSVADDISLDPEKLDSLASTLEKIEIKDGNEDVAAMA